MLGRGDDEMCENLTEWQWDVRNEHLIGMKDTQWTVKTWLRNAVTKDLSLRRGLPSEWWVIPHAHLPSPLPIWMRDSVTTWGRNVVTTDTCLQVSCPTRSHDAWVVGSSKSSPSLPELAQIGGKEDDDDVEERSEERASWRHLNARCEMERPKSSRNVVPLAQT